MAAFIVIIPLRVVAALEKGYHSRVSGNNQLFIHLVTLCPFLFLFQSSSQLTVFFFFFFNRSVVLDYNARGFEKCHLGLLIPCRTNPDCTSTGYRRGTLLCGTRSSGNQVFTRISAHLLDVTVRSRACVPPPLPSATEHGTDHGHL